jgi:uncharacterized protein YxeA
MKKLLKIILGTILTFIVIVALAGMYKFNILQDDIYFENEQIKEKTQ